MPRTAESVAPRFPAESSPPTAGPLVPGAFSAAVLPLFLIVSLGACAMSGRKAMAPAPAPQTAAAAPDAAQAALLAAKAQGSDYRIVPQDLLDITVFQEKDMDRAVRVDPSGRINLPLVGTVEIAGLTVPQAETKLQTLLQDYLIRPQVNVSIKEYHERKVILMGEVQKPGSYDIPPDKGLTVLQAIALAGGLTKIAAPDKTRVMRSHGAVSQEIQVPVNAITTNGDRSKDISVEPNDIIVVPQSLF